jgi:hypothetical protein
MTLTQLLAELYRRCDFSSTPPAAITTRLTAFLNTTQRQILRTPGLESLRDDTITFASVAGQALYGLPQAITKVEAITDRTTMWRLQLATLDDIRSSDPGLVTSGTPDTYILRGVQQVAVQPAAATGLWAVSTSGSDVQNCFIETVRTGGYQAVGAAVVLTGVTRKALGALTDHIEVTKFYVSSAAVGAISLFDAAAAGNELARIPIGGTYARYQGIQLYPTPASAITYYVDYVREIADMTNATDEPLLRPDFHDLLVEGALLKEWSKVDDSRRVDAERAYLKGLSALKYFATCPPDFLPSRGSGRGGRSRLGSYYPADR